MGAQRSPRLMTLAKRDGHASPTATDPFNRNVQHKSALACGDGSPFASESTRRVTATTTDHVWQPSIDGGVFVPRNPGQRPTVQHSPDQTPSPEMGGYVVQRLSPNSASIDLARFPSP